MDQLTLENLEHLLLLEGLYLLGDLEHPEDLVHLEDQLTLVLLCFPEGQ